MAAPAIGEVHDGFRFKGGDPNKETSWEAVPEQGVASPPTVEGVNLGGVADAHRSAAPIQTGPAAPLDLNSPENRSRMQYNASADSNRVNAMIAADPGKYGAIANDGLRPNDVMDILKGAPSDLEKGFASIPGMFGDVQQLGRRTYLRALEGMGAIPAGSSNAMAEMPAAIPMAGSGDFNRVIQNVQGQPYYDHKTTAGKYVGSAIQFLPSVAVGPGGVARKLVQAVGGGVGSQGAGDIAEAAGADDLGQSWARLVGGVGGASVAGLKRASAANAMAEPAPVQMQGNAMAQPLPLQDSAALQSLKITRAQAPQIRAKVAEYRDAGIDPTLADVVNEGQRGQIRAAASRNTPGRDAVQQFAEARALNLPDRIGKQARNILSQDPRTPDEIAADLGKARGVQADRDFGAVRGDSVTLSPEGIQALRHPKTLAAINEAAMRERDPEARAALNRLANGSLDNPSTPVTVGMVDRISRVLNGQAGVADRAGDVDLKSTLMGLSDSLRTPTRQDVPGYDNALNNYSAQSKLMARAGQGEDFLNRNTDEFVAGLKNASPEELALARATARRAVERAAGENVGSAPGVAKRLATAPEQMARNNALLGSDAPKFQNAMALEAKAVQNAQYVAPNTGPQSFNRAQDAIDTGGKLIGIAANAKAGNLPGAALKLADWWATKGMSKADAQRLAEMSIDPTKIDGVLRYIDTYYGHDAKTDFVNKLRAVPGVRLPALSSLGPAAVASTAAAQGQPQNQGPQVGQVVDGYRYKGGPINDPKSWEPVQ